MRCSVRPESWWQTDRRTDRQTRAFEDLDFFKFFQEPKIRYAGVRNQDNPNPNPNPFFFSFNVLALSYGVEFQYKIFTPTFSTHLNCLSKIFGHKSNFFLKKHTNLVKTKFSLSCRKSRLRWYNSKRTENIVSDWLHLHAAILISYFCVLKCPILVKECPS